MLLLQDFCKKEAAAQPLSNCSCYGSRALCWTANQHHNQHCVQDLKAKYGIFWHWLIVVCGHIYCPVWIQHWYQLLLCFRRTWIILLITTECHWIPLFPGNATTPMNTIHQSAWNAYFYFIFGLWNEDVNCNFKDTRTIQKHFSIYMWLLFFYMYVCMYECIYICIVTFSSFYRYPTGKLAGTGFFGDLGSFRT